MLQRGEEGNGQVAGGRKITTSPFHAGYAPRGANPSRCKMGWPIRRMEKQNSPTMAWCFATSRMLIWLVVIHSRA